MYGWEYNAEFNSIIPDVLSFQQLITSTDKNSFLTNLFLLQNYKINRKNICQARNSTHYAFHGDKERASETDRSKPIIDLFKTRNRRKNWIWCAVISYITDWLLRHRTINEGRHSKNNFTPPILLIQTTIQNSFVKIIQ